MSRHLQLVSATSAVFAQEADEFARAVHALRAGTPSADDEPLPPPPPAPNDACRYGLREVDAWLAKLDKLQAQALTIVVRRRASPAVQIYLDVPGELEAWLDQQQVRPYRVTDGAALRQWHVCLRDCLLIWPDTTPRSAA